MTWILRHKGTGEAPEVPLNFEKWLPYQWFVTNAEPLKFDDGFESSSVFTAPIGGRVWHVGQFMFAADLTWINEMYNDTMPYFYPIDSTDVLVNVIGLDKSGFSIYTLRNAYLIEVVSEDEMKEFVEYIKWLAELRTSYAFEFHFIPDGGFDDGDYYDEQIDEVAHERE